MGTNEKSTFSLQYGTTGKFECELPEEDVVASFVAPAACEDLKANVLHAMQEPLDFPPFSSCVIPDDKLTLVIDPETPGLLTLVEVACELALEAGLAPEQITLLLPAHVNQKVNDQLAAHLAANCSPDIQLIKHDPTMPNGGSYLASSSTSERIHLNPAILDADVILPIGHIAFAPLLGIKGNFSALYPSMSSTEAIQNSHGQANVELEPEDDRQLHQLVEEIGWLLGIQFTLQVIGSNKGGVSTVLAGAPESVMRRGKELLEQEWSVKLPERLETVIVSVEQSGSGEHGWREVCAAIETGRKLVEHEGRLIVLTQLKEKPGPGIIQLAHSDFPTDVMRELRETLPEDVIPASQLARALDWARIYFLSDLENDFIEDLFMVPVESEADLNRLLKSTPDSTVLIHSAQSVHSHITSN